MISFKVLQGFSGSEIVLKATTELRQPTQLIIFN